MSRRSDHSLDIEDLSRMLKLATGSKPAGAVATADLSIPIIVDVPEEGEADPGVTLVDSLTSDESVAFRFANGWYLRFRLAVLGIGEAVEDVHALIYALLGDATVLAAGIVSQDMPGRQIAAEVRHGGFDFVGFYVQGVAFTLGGAKATGVAKADFGRGRAR